MLNIPLLRTKIIPPPRHARTLPRQRVSQTLKQALDYRLTLLQAGAGYGKSTALAELAGEISPFTWYQVNEEDTDARYYLALQQFSFWRETVPKVCANRINCALKTFGTFIPQFILRIAACAALVTAS